MLRDLGVERRVVSTLSNLAVAPHVVAQSDLLCSAAEPIVGSIADRLGLQVLEHPLPLPRQCVYAAWHERTDRNAGHLWFRDLLRRTLTTATSRS
jgi:DNA-binding transcriptional LysR family regulator